MCGGGNKEANALVLFVLSNAVVGEGFPWASTDLNWCFVSQFPLSPATGGFQCHVWALCHNQLALVGSIQPAKLETSG